MGFHSGLQAALCATGFQNIADALNDFPCQTNAELVKTLSIWNGGEPLLIESELPHGEVFVG